MEQAKGVCLSGFEGTKQALKSKAERAAVGTCFFVERNK
jgi:hypothetical protein